MGARMSEHQIFRKCARRLIPLMLLLYMVNYIDRVNVGFAALTMNKDLDFSRVVYGFGAGVFFLAISSFKCRRTGCWSGLARGDGCSASWPFGA
jgi:ACS family tartrate transporter-like MFS transporter